MGIVKGAKQAKTIRCKSAVTKEVFQAVTLESHNASYRNIDTHKVVAAGVSDVRMKNVKFMQTCSISFPENADIGDVNIKVSDYINVNDNLTIDDLFDNAGRKH